MNDHQVEPAALLSGFEAAQTRFAAAVPASDEAFHAIFEALAWIGAIHQRLSEDHLACPPIVEGLYYMRNVVLHQGADVIAWFLRAYGEGTYGSGPYGGVGVRWPVSGEFKAPRSRTGKEEYQELLADTSVIETLGEAGARLREVCGLSADSAKTGAC